MNKILVILIALLLTGCATVESTVPKTNVIVNSKTMIERSYPKDEFLSKCGWLQDIDSLYLDPLKREKDYNTLSQCKVKQEHLSKWIKELIEQDKKDNQK